MNKINNKTVTVSTRSELKEALEHTLTINLEDLDPSSTKTIKFQVSKK